MLKALYSQNHFLDDVQNIAFVLKKKIEKNETLIPRITFKIQRFRPAQHYKNITTCFKPRAAVSIKIQKYVRLP